MTEQTSEARKRSGIKRPLIVLGVSLGAVVIGSAVCSPGICGCTSWAGLTVYEKIGEGAPLFAILAMAGTLAGAGSLCWLLFELVRAVARRSA